MSEPSFQPIVMARRLVIKVGSSLVTNDGRGLDRAALSRWAAQISALIGMGKEVIMVSSGAIAEGMQRLGWPERPTQMHSLQAAAAVGQMGLAQAYETCFAAFDLKTAQVLLTHADLADRSRYLNARSTLFTLLGLGVVPIINENDTVVTDEIRFGDNDTLAALVANLVEAESLIILTDQAGLFDADPRKVAGARLIGEASATDATLESLAGGAGSGVGTGGMATKVLAARRAAASGAHTVIASGRENDVLVRLARGEAIGTALRASVGRRSAKKQWMADHLKFAGRIEIDEGARNALAAGKSLLAAGVRAVSGRFARGDVIACVDNQGIEQARGISNYDSAEVQRILGKSSTEFETVLGYVAEAELIHRDNLVVVAELQKTF